ncbi:unnamed protein product [Lactuca saligna]|uniref:Uncharacterized protein n=1 Tax=Lactuca saligna TaxID=75948 RepID=A0AA36E7A8_LACSI|nr:unnamed protein product [Lactuca saligna]
MESKDHLNKFKVGSVPMLYYILDFISDSDKKLLLNQEGLSMKKVLCLKIPHQDGPAYFPMVAILSLGSPVVVDFTPHSTLADTTSNIQETSHGNLQNYPPFSIALMPRSLLVFKDTTYSGHGCTWIPVIENFTVHHVYRYHLHETDSILSSVLLCSFHLNLSAIKFMICRI